MKLYSIRDVVAGVYNGIYMFSNDEVASRWFGKMCEGDNAVAMFCKDMQLFRVGAFDENTGFLESEVPTLIVKGVDFDGISE